MAIYHGKADKVEIDDAANMVGASDLGYSKKVLLDAKAIKAELMPGNLQVGCTGIVDIEIAETGDTNETVLMARHGLVSYVRITDPAGNTYVAGPFVAMIGMKRTFKDPKEPHVYTIKGEENVDVPSDFITGPTAPV